MMLVALAATALPLVAASDLLPGERLRVRTLTFPYTTGAFYTMPHEKVALGVTAAPPRLFGIEAPQGALIAVGPNTWTWEAPGEKGRYAVEARNPARSKVMDFYAFVMAPASDV